MPGQSACRRAEASEVLERGSPGSFVRRAEDGACAARTVEVADQDELPVVGEVRDVVRPWTGRQDRPESDIARVQALEVRQLPDAVRQRPAGARTGSRSPKFACREKPMTAQSPATRRANAPQLLRRAPKQALPRVLRAI